MNEEGAMGNWWRGSEISRSSIIRGRTMYIRAIDLGFSYSSMLIGFLDERGTGILWVELVGAGMVSPVRILGRGDMAQ